MSAVFPRRSTEGAAASAEAAFATWLWCALTVAVGSGAMGVSAAQPSDAPEGRRVTVVFVDRLTVLAPNGRRGVSTRVACVFEETTGADLGADRAVWEAWLGTAAGRAAARGER
ncbi:MAG: hypothetical protein ACOX6M_07575 [Armatimonadota bacterium]